MYVFMHNCCFMFYHRIDALYIHLAMPWMCPYQNSSWSIFMANTALSIMKTCHKVHNQNFHKSINSSFIIASISHDSFPNNWQQYTYQNTSCITFHTSNLSNCSKQVNNCGFIVNAIFLIFPFSIVLKMCQLQN